MNKDFRHFQLIALTSVVAILLCVISAGNWKRAYVEDAGACELNMRMVYIKGGEFEMGGTVGDELAGSDEHPVHDVKLDSYYISATEVTQEQWYKVMGTTIQTQARNAKEEVEYEGPQYPMCYVTWGEAMDFCHELSKLTGITYVLPTEAQWEYAARGGGKSKGYRYSGSSDNDDVAWCYENSGSEAHMVATKKPNELGLYDMGGNVWEWCSDWYGDYPSSFQYQPAGPGRGSEKVLRGGCWQNQNRACRVSHRGHGSPKLRLSRYGFRVVALIEETK